MGDDSLDSLLDTIPDVENPVSGGGIISTAVRLVGVDSPRNESRAVLKTWTKDDRLYTLDEYVGTVVTMVSVVFAVAALLAEQHKYTLGGVSAITLLFFWVTYRIAKAKHAVELRISILSGFCVFAPLSLFFLAVLYIGSFIEDLPDWLDSVLLLSVPIFSLVFYWALQREYFKEVGRYIWSRLSKEPVKWSGVSSIGMDGLRSAVEDLALMLYPASMIYGMLSTTLFFTLILFQSTSQYFLAFLVSALLGLFCIYVVWGGLKESSYARSLRRVGEAKRNLSS